MDRQRVLASRQASFFKANRSMEGAEHENVGELNVEWGLSQSDFENIFGRILGSMDSKLSLSSRIIIESVDEILLREMIYKNSAVYMTPTMRVDAVKAGYYACLGLGVWEQGIHSQTKQALYKAFISNICYMPSILGREYDASESYYWDLKLADACHMMKEKVEEPKQSLKKSMLSAAKRASMNLLRDVLDKDSIINIHGIYLREQDKRLHSQSLGRGYHPDAFKVYRNILSILESIYQFSKNKERNCQDLYEIGLSMMEKLMLERGFFVHVIEPFISHRVAEGNVTAIHIAIKEGMDLNTEVTSASLGNMGQAGIPIPLQDAKHALEVTHRDGDSEGDNCDCPLQWLSEH